MKSESDNDFEDDESWEEVECTQQATQIVDSPAFDGKDENGNISFTLQAKKKQKRKGITKADREHQADLHKAHTVLLLMNAREKNNICDYAILKALVLSQVPPQLLNRVESILQRLESPKKTKKVEVVKKRTTARQQKRRRKIVEEDDDFEEDDTGKTNDSVISILEELVNWWTRTFKINANDQMTSSLIESAMKMQGSQSVSSILFISLCRSLGFHSRFIIRLNPISLSVTISSMTSSSSSKEEPVPATLSGGIVVHPPSNKRTKSKGKKEEECANISDIWTEIYDPIESKWIYLDLLNKTSIGVDNLNFDSFENQLSYIASVEPTSGRIKDVTAKYVKDLTATKLRKSRCDEWITTILSQHFNGVIINEQAESADTAEIEARIRKTGLPSSISAFHNHPLYVMERHLKKYEIIHPMTEEMAIGKIRGENIYPRSLVQTLHTADKWLSLEGRIIKRGERPLKSVKSRSTSSASRDRKRIKRLVGEDDDADEDRENSGSTNGESPNQVGLFGEWQTEVFVPPPIVNGVIPKNKYQNIDMFKSSMLPPGAVHLKEETIFEDEETDFTAMRQNVRLPTLKKIAKKLDIDFAEAVTGFDYHGGWSVPRLEGIVIAAENEELVRKEYIDQVLACLEKLRKEREQKVAAQWERLVKKALNHLRLKEQFLNN